MRLPSSTIPISPRWRTWAACTHFSATWGFAPPSRAGCCSGDPGRGRNPGQTCDDPDYRRWLLDLHAAGFEIGWHGATWHSVPRAVTIEALDRFKAVFGHDPRTAANHAGADEGIYWAAARLSGAHALLYKVLTRWRYRGQYRGHVQGDPCFWGDVCQKRIRYFRNFAFRDVEHPEGLPLDAVPRSAAALRGPMVRQLRRARRTQLQPLPGRGRSGPARGGRGGVHHVRALRLRILCRRASAAAIPALLERLAGKNGWFVPVSTLLDHLLAAGAAAT